MPDEPVDATAPAIPSKGTLARLSIVVQNRFLAGWTPPTPSRLRVFYIGGYWRGPNDVVAQMLQGLQATGVNVVDFNTDLHRDALDTDGHLYDRGTTSPVWLVREKLFPPILSFRPHIVICNAGGLSFRPHDADELRKLGIRLLTLVLSDPMVYEPTTSKIARNFDVLITFIEECVALYRRHGPRVYLAPCATNHLFFHPVEPRPEYACEVLVLGAVHADRIAPVKALVERFDTHVYGEHWDAHGIPSRGFLFGDDALSALGSARMAVVFPRTISGLPVLKAGLLDFPAAGALVVTEDFPVLHDYFVVGQEIIASSSTEDMLEKIRYYLDHPQEAEAIRKAGRERVVNHYTWDRVWPKVLPSVMPIRGWSADPEWIRSFLLSAEQVHT